MSDITIVSGLGRCGSSLVMQMLAAGGHPVFEPEEALPPAYENVAALGLPQRHEFLQRAHGTALKVLDPHKFRLPAIHHYRVIWCDRDPREQAKSQMKFLGAMFGVARSRDDRRAIERGLRRDRGACLALFLKMPRASLLVVRFEDLLSWPLAAAEKIARFAGLPQSAEAAMAGRVVRRSPLCFDGMMELQQMEAIGGV